MENDKPVAQRLTHAIAVSLFLYTCDLSLAITAWVIGFGLEVKNWTALIALGIVSRWVFHVVMTAHMKHK